MKRKFGVVRRAPLCWPGRAGLAASDTKDRLVMEGISCPAVERRRDLLAVLGEELVNGGKRQSHDGIVSSFVNFQELRLESLLLHGLCHGASGLHSTWSVLGADDHQDRKAFEPVPRNVLRL